VAVITTFSKPLYCTKTSRAAKAVSAPEAEADQRVTNLPTNDDNFLRPLGLAFQAQGLGEIGLQSFFIASNENGSVLLDNIVLGQRIKGRSILDVAGRNIEAGFESSAPKKLA
jgi:hypothetical protein